MPGRQDQFDEVLAPLNASRVNHDRCRCRHSGSAVGVAGSAVKIKPQSVGGQIFCTLNRQQMRGLMVLGLEFLGHRNVAAALGRRSRRELQRQQRKHQQEQENTHK
jgi:hypothetical protein